MKLVFDILPSVPNLLSLLGEEGVSCREFR